MSAWENGKRRADLDDLGRLDALFSTGGTLSDLWQSLTRQGAYATWFRDAVATEAKSTESREYAPLLVPGTLQTEGYAAESIRQGNPGMPPEKIVERVAGRTERYKLLTGERGLLAQFVIEEHVLRRPIGSSRILVDQLDHLVALAALPRVTIQIVPMNSLAHPGMDGPFILFTVPERGMVAYTESRYTSDPREDREVTDGYMAVWSDLKGAALPVPGSLDLIRKIKEEVE